MQTKFAALLIFYFIIFLNQLGYFLILPTLSTMITSPNHGLLSLETLKEFGNYIYAIVLGAGSLAAMFFAPILGRLSDIIGRKNALLCCAVLMILSFVFPLIAFAQKNIWLFLLGNVLNGISSNIMPVAQAGIRDVSPKNSFSMAYRYCIQVSFIVTAMTSAPLLAGIFSNSSLSPYFSYSTPFWMATGLSLIALILILWLPSNTSSPALSHSAFSLRSFSDISRLPKTLLRLLAVTLLLQTAWAQYFQYIFLYLPSQFGFTEIKISFFTALSGGTMLISLLGMFPLLHPKFSLRQIVFFCTLLSTLALGMMGLSSREWIQWLFMPILSIGIGLYLPCLLAVFALEIQNAQRGWILAIVNSSIGLAWFIAGFSAIFLSDFLPSLPLSSAAFLCLVAGVLMHLDKNTH